MYLLEVHLVNEGVVKLKAPLDLPFMVDATDHLLKFQFANGTTYAFVTENVIYYVARKVES